MRIRHQVAHGAHSSHRYYIGGNSGSLLCSTGYEMPQIRRSVYRDVLEVFERTKRRESPTPNTMNQLVTALQRLSPVS